jgi:VanZ family protein
VGLIAFGILIELIQGTISYRTSEWMDLLGDTLGIALGLIIAALGVGGWSVWIEERLGS